MQFIAVFSATISFQGGKKIEDETFIFRVTTNDKERYYIDEGSHMRLLNTMLRDYLMCSAGYDPTGYSMIPLELASGVKDYTTESGPLFAINIHEINYFRVNELKEFFYIQ